MSMPKSMRNRYKFHGRKWDAKMMDILTKIVHSWHAKIGKIQQKSDARNVHGKRRPGPPWGMSFRRSLRTHVPESWLRGIYIYIYIYMIGPWFALMARVDRMKFGVVGPNVILVFPLGYCHHFS